MPVNATESAALLDLAKSFTSSFEQRDRLSAALREHLGVGPRDSFYVSDDGTDDALGPVVIYRMERDAFAGEGGALKAATPSNGDETAFRVTYARLGDGYTFGEPVKVRRVTSYEAVRDSDAGEGVDAGQDETEVPEWLAGALARAATLVKGAGHRYIRRVPKSGGGYRYFYKVSGGGGLGHEDEMKVGAKFRVAHGGKDGHFEIVGKDDNGNLRIKHDESGHESSVSPAALRGMLHAEHAQSLTTHRDKLAADIKATDDPKAKAKLLAEAGKYEHTRDLVAPEKPSNDLSSLKAGDLVRPHTPAGEPYGDTWAVQGRLADGRITIRNPEKGLAMVIDPAKPTDIRKIDGSEKPSANVLTFPAKPATQVGPQFSATPSPGVTAGSPEHAKWDGYDAGHRHATAQGSMSGQGRAAPVNPHAAGTPHAEAWDAGRKQGARDAGGAAREDADRPAPPPKKTADPGVRERGFTGEKYDSTKRVADIAKELRETFKTTLPPGVKLGIKTRNYSGGSAIDVTIKDAPFPILNPERVRWHAANPSHATPPREGPAAERYTPEGKALLEKVQSEMDKHNRNNSDSRSDYYDVGFSSHVDVDDSLKERDRSAAQAAGAPAQVSAEKQPRVSGALPAPMGSAPDPRDAWNRDHGHLADRIVAGNMSGGSHGGVLARYKIHNVDGKTESAAGEMHGQYGVHRTSDGDDRLGQSPKYKVTHIPTGKGLGPEMNEDDAHKLAQTFDSKHRHFGRDVSLGGTPDAGEFKKLGATYKKFMQARQNERDKVQKSMSTVTDPERDLAKSLAASHRTAAAAQPDPGAKAAHEVAAKLYDAGAEANDTAGYRKSLGQAGSIGGLIKAWSNIPPEQRRDFGAFAKSMAQPGGPLGCLPFQASNGTGDALGQMGRAFESSRPPAEQVVHVAPEPTTYSPQRGAVNGMRKSMGSFYDRLSAGAAQQAVQGIRCPPEAKV